MNTTTQTTEKFDATIEFVRPGTAILTLTDSRGEWSGSGTISVWSDSKDDLYEQGYIMACLSAKSKGGRIETYKWANA